MLRFVRVDASTVIGAHSVTSVRCAETCVEVWSGSYRVWRSPIFSDNAVLEREFKRVVGLFRQTERTVD